MNSSAENVESVAALDPPVDDGAVPEIDTISGGDEDAEAQAQERAFLEMRQRQRKQLIRACAGIQLFDFTVLSMPDWPENFELAQARRRRDQWVFVMSALVVVFLAGVGNLVPAWLAGASFGALVLAGLFGVPPVRRMVTEKPSYAELLGLRRRLLRHARKHIAHLEGATGLAWQCQPLSEYHPALRQTRFQSLFNLSRTGNLARYIRSRVHVRLYLMFLLEAEKAYEIMQTRYFESHQEAMERGWAGPDPQASISGNAASAQPVPPDPGESQDDTGDAAAADPADPAP